MLPPSLIPGPEKSQLVSGDATVAEIDGLEPDTEYIVRVRTHVAGVDGAPASVVVRTGEWLLASYSHTALAGPGCCVSLTVAPAHARAAQ